MNIVSAEHLSKSHGDRMVLRDISFGIDDQDRIGLIGANGAGKSTLLELLASCQEPDTGTIAFGKHVVVHYLPQEPAFDLQATALANVVHDGDEYAAKDMLMKLGISDYEVPVALLSGGQRKRIALARALLSPCDLLILDEPTNHIDHETVRFLETYLQKRKGALFMVTHDRYFLDRVATRIIELDRGLLYQYPGNYEAFLEAKIQRVTQDQASEEKRQNFLRNEIEWIRKGPKARGTKQKARTDRYYEILEKTPDEKSSTLDLSVASTRLGNSILEIDHVTKGYQERILIQGFSYLVKRHDRIGVIGLSGTGKSTFLKLLAGLETPDQGVIKTGATVRIGYFSQDHEQLPEHVRVIEWIQQTARYVVTDDGQTLSAAQMLERFLFPSSMHGTLIQRLSGGEKRRLALLRVLLSSPNVLLLDEITNDLDIPTLSALELYLDEFKGAVIAASHDRYFLDRVVDHVFVFSGDGKIQRYLGNYSDYLARSTDEDKPVEKKAGKSDDTFRPRRSDGMKHTKLTFNEQRDYDVIDDQIEQMEQALRQITQEMQEAGDDSERVQTLYAKQQQLESELDALLARWTYLHEKVEQIEREQQQK